VNLKPKLIIGVSVIVYFCIICAGCFAPAQKSETSVFQVCCTAEADWPKGATLEQLKDMPVSELNEPGIDGVMLIKESDTNQLSVQTWREFSRFTEQGYEPADNANLGLSSWLIKSRGFIPFVEKSQPSRMSHVRNLPMDRRLLKHLPIDLGPQISNEEIEAAKLAASKGKTWVDFYPDTKILQHTKTMTLLRADDWEIRLRIMAYGDYNHDGIEDVLVCISHASPGTLAYSFNVILTRSSGNQALQRVTP